MPKTLCPKHALFFTKFCLAIKKGIVEFESEAVLCDI